MNAKTPCEGCGSNTTRMVGQSKCTACLLGVPRSSRKPGECWWCGKPPDKGGLCWGCRKAIQSNNPESKLVQERRNRFLPAKPQPVPASDLSWKGTLTMGKRLKKDGERFRVSPYDLGPEPMSIPSEYCLLIYAGISPASFAKNDTHRQMILS